MNKLSKAFLTTFLVMASLTITSMLMGGCKNTSEPDEYQAYDSEAAADITAASLGTESGGAGVSFSDASALTEKGNIESIIPNAKSGSPMGRTYSFDPVTKEHTLAITRSIEWGKFSFDALITYKYTFYGASNVKLDSFVKGATDRIDISVNKARSLQKGERLNVEDDAAGSWSITNILSGAPVLNGIYGRNGTVNFLSKDNKDRAFSYTLAINFNNDLIVKSADGKHTYLKGTATSDFTGTTEKYEFKRHTDITFDGEGMANLLITRTSGDGTTETHEVDVKVGYWKRRIR